MHQLSYDTKASIPVFKCSQCGECLSVEAENSFGINRGCCFYFPKYTLTNIRYLAGHDPEFLEKLRSLPDTIISDFDLVVRGDLDFEGLQSASKSRDDRQNDSGSEGRFDSSLRFRKCRFITEHGCSIRFDQRPHPCNLYLCRSVIDQCQGTYREFARERKDYFSYVQYTDRLLEEALSEQGLTMQSDFRNATDTLLNTPIDEFDFADLGSILFETN